MKKLAAITVLSIAFAGASAFKTISGNGKVIMTVAIEVKNFTEWKKIFDAGAPVREKAGIKVLSVCSSSENENNVLVIEQAESMQSAKDFLGLLKSKQKSGEVLKLDVKLYNQKD